MRVPSIRPVKAPSLCLCTGRWRSAWLACLLGSLLLGMAPAEADTLLVQPDGLGPYATLQDAVDAAMDGDQILLASGLYLGPGNRNVDISGLAVTIRSASGMAADCVIDCAGSAVDPARAFHCAGGAGTALTLRDLTLRGGYVPHESAWLQGAGGALLIDEARVSIEGCHFTENEAATGGAVHLNAGAELELLDCRFAINGAELEGGALACWQNSRATIAATTFSQNVAGFRGGAIACNDESEVSLAAVLAVGNGAQSGGALYACGHSGVALTGCTLLDNAGALGACVHGSCYAQILIDTSILAFSASGWAVQCVLDAEVNVSCSDIYGNPEGDWTGCVAEHAGIAGNLCADPLFCDRPAGDFTLDGDSPCGPTANPTCGLIGAFGVGCGASPAEATSWGRVKWEFFR